MQVRPGDDCEVVSLDPGSYVIETHHDHRNVPPGQVGFVHLPGRTNIAGDPGSASSATFSFMAWKGPDGGFVTTSGGEGDLTAFQDPEAVEKVIARFLARAQLETGPFAGGAASPALTLLQASNGNPSQGLFNLLAARG